MAGAVAAVAVRAIARRACADCCTRAPFRCIATWPSGGTWTAVRTALPGIVDNHPRRQPIVLHGREHRRGGGRLPVGVLRATDLLLGESDKRRGSPVGAGRGRRRRSGATICHNNISHYVTGGDGSPWTAVKPGIRTYLLQATRPKWIYCYSSFSTPGFRGATTSPFATFPPSPLLPPHSPAPAAPSSHNAPAPALSRPRASWRRTFSGTARTRQLSRAPSPSLIRRGRSWPAPRLTAIAAPSRSP